MKESIVTSKAEALQLVVVSKNGATQIVDAALLAELNLKAGDKLRVIKEAKEKAYEDLVVIQKGDNLEIVYADGSAMTLEGFYALDNIALELPTSEYEMHLLSSNVESGTELSIVYAQGDMSAFASMFESNDAMLQALNNYNTSIDSGLNAAGEAAAAGAAEGATGSAGAAAAGTAGGAFAGVSTATLVAGGVVAAGVVAAAASSSSSGGGSSSSSDTGDAGGAGAFVDTYVAGATYIRYDSDGNETGRGTTGSAGQFAYESGETVAFYVGNVKIGEIAVANINSDGFVTLQDLFGVPRGEIGNDDVVEAARFLQTFLDDTTGTIVIPADEDLPLALQSTTATADATDIGAAITAAQSAGLTVPTDAEAIAHLIDTMADVVGDENFQVEAGETKVNITFNDTTIANGETTTVTLMFLNDNNEIPAGFTLSDLFITGGTLSALTQVSGTNIVTATFTPTLSYSGDVSITVNPNGTLATAELVVPSATVDTVLPTVTAGNISLSGASGLDGSFVEGDTVTVTFDNVTEGNTDLSKVEVVFDELEASTTVQATLQADGTYVATYTVTSDTINGSTLNISVVATDSHGNASAGTELSADFAVDTVAPTIAIDTDIATDMILDATEDNSIFQITGTSDYTTNGKEVVVTLNGATYYTVTANGNGSWSVDIPASIASALPEGDLEITATIADDAGNQTTATSSILHTTSALIQIDPIDYVNETVDSSDVTITGTNSNITSGDMTVTITDGTTTLTDTVTLDGTNTWTTTAPINISTLTEGNITVTTSVAGAEDATTSFVYDSGVPAVTDVSIPEGDYKVGDEIEVTITTGEAGLTVAPTINSVLLTDVTDNGDGTYTAIYEVDEGETDVAASGNLTTSIVVTDAAGNTDTYTTPVTLTANQSIDANTASVTNVTVANTAIGVGTVTVSITANEAGLTLVDGSTVAGYTLSNLVDNGGGNYTAEFTVAEGDGYVPGSVDLAVNVTMQDANGNQTAAYTTAISQANDSIEANTPDAPTVNTISDDNLINDSENTAGFNLTGTGEVDATITVTGFETADKTATVQADGTWTIAVADADLADNGSNTLSVTATDANGNESEATTTTITTDLVADAAPVITSPTADYVVNADENTDLVVSGTGVAGSTVTLAVANQTAVVDAEGNWSITVADAAATFGEGAETLSVTQTDVAGNESVAGTQDITIDTVAPTVAITSSGIDTTGTPTISGTAEADATVTVVFAGATYSVTATGGTWSVDTSSATPDSGTLAITDNAANSVSVTATDAAGNTSDAVTQSLAVYSSEPFISINTIATDDIVNASEDGGNITISGVTANVADTETVTLTVGGVEYTTTVSGDAWSVTTVDSTLFTEGNITITADVTTATQATTSITYDATLPVVSSITLAEGDYKAGDTVSVTIDAGEAGLTLGGTLNGDALGTVTDNGDGTYTTSFVVDTDTITASITATDAAGNATAAPQTTVTSTNVTIDSSVPAVASISATDDTYAVGDTVAITVTMDEAVTVDTTNGTPTLTLDNGATATYASGSGTTDLVFNYVVAEGDTDSSDLDVTAINLNSGTIADAAGNNADLTVGTELVDNNAVVVDGNTPGITSNNVAIITTLEDSTDVSPSGTDGSYIPTDVIAVEITADNAETSLSFVSATINGVALAGGDFKEVGVGVYEFTYTVTEGDNDLVAGFNMPISITLADAAGNEVTYNTPIAVAAGIDANSPVAPSISLAEDTGTASDDNLTNDATVNVTLNEVGGTWEYSVNNGVAWTTGTSFELAEATYTAGDIQVREIDAEGNVGAIVSTTADITVDTTASATTVTINSITEDTDDSSTDFTTNQSTVTVAATLSAAVATEVVEYSIDGGTTWQNDANVSVVDTAVEIANIDATTVTDIQIRAVDTAGNAGTAATQAITYDGTSPTQTITIDSIEEHANDSVADFTTNVTSADVLGTLSGPLVGGERVQYSVDGGTTWSDASVANTTEITVANVDTTTVTEIQLQVIDPAGNVGATATQTITLDNTAPTITIDTIATDNIIDGTEDNSDVIISGTTTGAEEGQIVTVTVDGQQFTQDANGDITVAADGTWSMSYAQAYFGVLLTTGTATVTADVNDASGNAATQASTTVTYVTDAAITIDAIEGELEGDFTISGKTSNV